MADRYSRQITYMRISVTDLCNMRCQYCMPEEGVEKRTHEDLLSFEEIVSIVKASVPLGIRKIRITGGEPLVRNGIVSLVEQLRQINGIEEIAMTTNGTLLKSMAKPLKEAGLNRFNISIDSLKEDRYREITRGGRLSDVLEGIETVLSLGMTPLKLNTVVIGGLNDDEVKDFTSLTINEHIDVRFIELMPVGEASQWAENRFISNDVLLEKLGFLLTEQRENGSPAQYYRLPGAMGRVGFINPISHHFCHECNRIRLTSDGRLKPCLHSNDEIDLRSVLHQPASQITKVIAQAIDRKPERHQLDQDERCTSRNMCQIGG
ncbi:GTP 3',8-cyclase MoaA [Anoxynatronum buryatiense]|uniref:GTP 3',8-cyclase n=1 Tax=Anoxynatronum buryatiense TaxID=489973 RepID=A0AA46AI53_9CLOT|nr:GTP 3',8-cyclase MoaA [Anoxynatronum buryatiense]SMP45433.1 cyclic pyranopterin monophosphate synthase subunit MoaA [Anoxynatronum buryatiense]